MTTQRAYSGDLLCGEVRAVVPETYSDQATREVVTVTSLFLLVGTDRGGVAVEVLRLPAGVPADHFKVGTIVALPVTTYFDRSSSKILRAIRTDVPIFPAPSYDRRA